ncbi:MAG: nitroreductase family protein [Deltaproteobacteria bacterium]|nr:nitroreductase family protein [Deltaproteobacteria bacterium]
MSDFATLLTTARTCRRFEEDKPVASATLRKIVDAVRITSSCANRQPLRYYTVTSPDVRARVFPHIKWAGALPEWPGPAEGERPTGYIVICSAQPDGLFVHYDTGIAAQSMQCMPPNWAWAAA